MSCKKLCLPKNQGGLGFKDLETFNLALLSKQVWKLIHNTDSLLYKVFKAKYFPHCTILDDEIKMKGSYAWQSILKARSLVRIGLTWRVGNGEKVCIRGDNWLLNQFSRKSYLLKKTFQITLMSTHS